MFYQNHRPELPIHTPKPPSKRGGIREEASRDDFQRSIRVRHKRKATSEASSSLGAAASWRTARDPSLAEISSPWSTTLRLASWGKVLVCSWGCKEILSCNWRILYEIDLSRFLLMMLWCLIVRDLALGLLCSCMVYLDYINYRVLLICYRLSSCSDSMREGKVLILEHTFGRLDLFFVAWRLHL